MTDEPTPKTSRHLDRWRESADDGITVVEDFVPAWRSLAWRLGQAYWHQRGLQAFTTNAVPNVVTNDGYLATATAETLLASCKAADAGGTLETEIRVMELAVGLGQHARIFLRRFVELCAAEKLDYADRLVFFATDLSRATLDALRTSPTLRVPGVRVRLGQLDATEPSRFTDLESGEVETLADLRLIRTNYMLCVLPFMLLMRRGGVWCEQYVRTRIQDMVNARKVLGERLDEIITAAGKGDEDALQRIAPHEYLFSTERIYVPIADEELAMAPVAVSFFDAARAAVDEEGVERTLFSHGALRSLDRSLDLLLDDGFMIHSDYGWRTLQASSDIGNFQYFSGSTAIGLNFPLVEHFVEGCRDVPGRVVAPPGDEKSPILSRLVSRRALPAAEEAFAAKFDGRRPRRLLGHHQRPLVLRREAGGRRDPDALRGGERTFPVQLAGAGPGGERGHLCRQEPVPGAETGHEGAGDLPGRLGGAVV